MTASNTKTGKAPARRPAQPRATRPLPPRPQPDDGPPPPLLPPGPPEILRFTSAAPEREERRSVLFTIDDDEFTVLDNPAPQVGIEYLDRMRRQGAMMATMWLLEEMLGTGSYAALVKCKGLPQAGLQRVIEVCVEKADAAMTPPKEDSG